MEQSTSGATAEKAFPIGEYRKGILLGLPSFPFHCRQWSRALIGTVPLFILNWTSKRACKAGTPARGMAAFAERRVSDHSLTSGN
jgi:hypothetical protein